MRHVLVSATIGNEAITAWLKVERGYQVAHSSEEVLEKDGITRAEGSEGREAAPRYQQNMQRVGRSRVVKGQQRLSLVETLDREQESGAG